MGKITGFLEIPRRDRPYAKVEERIKNWHEFVQPLGDEAVAEQASRCMDCGVPFCHTGCPVNNMIPDWNNLVYRDQWRAALITLHSTNNFPEFTGRICPAPCEAACTLNIDNSPVTIKTIECAIVDRGWAEGWILPEPPAHKSGRSVAVVGSGPAGLACAQQLAHAGHAVTVYEKSNRIGGLLRYGIPGFKMDKPLVERRVAQITAEGVEFRSGIAVGHDVSLDDLRNRHDAVVLAGGAELPRDLPVPGRTLPGVHFAMDYLVQQNRRDAGDGENIAAPGGMITANGKHVVVIGGGDTGSDCIGTAIRQGALSVTQLEIMPRPPVQEDKALTWPNWPLKLRSSHAHEEGAARDFAVRTTGFAEANGVVSALEGVRIGWEKGAGGRLGMIDLADGAFSLPAELVLLAMGFTGPVQDGMIAQAGLTLDPRGNVAANTEDYRTSIAGVFAAGDMRRGQSLVVWAIREGRQCARAVDLFLMGTTTLPR